MRTEKRPIGTGITPGEQVIQIPENAAELRLLLQEKCASPSFEDALAQLEAWAERIIQEAKLPLPLYKHVRILSDGSWCDDLTPGEQVSSASVMSLVDSSPGIDSPTWYAVQICFWLDQRRRALLSEDWQEVQRAAYAIGHYHMTVILKQWDRAATYGDNNLKIASRNGQERAAKYRTRKQYIHAKACDYFARHPRGTRRSAEHLCGGMRGTAHRHGGLSTAV